LSVLTPTRVAAALAVPVLAVGAALLLSESEPSEFYLRFIDQNATADQPTLHEVQYRDLPEFPEFWFDEVARPWVTIPDANDRPWPHCRQTTIAPPDKGQIRARLVRAGVASEWSNILPFDNTTSSPASYARFVDPNDAVNRTTTIELEWRGERPPPIGWNFQPMPPWEPLPASGDGLWNHCRETTIAGLRDGAVRSRFLSSDGEPITDWSAPIFVPEPPIAASLAAGAILMLKFGMVRVNARDRRES